MALTSRSLLPVPCTRVDVCAGVRARSVARIAVCAAKSENPEHVPQLPRRAAVLLSVPFLLAASPARADFLQLEDSRASGAREAMESADQARDDSLDERRRFSFETVDKLDVNGHQRRAKESYRRLTNDVKQYLDKNLLNRVSNELGLQMGSLRYDLEQIAGRDKAAKAKSKDALKAIERLNTYARLNQQNEANEAYSVALEKLGNIVKAYG